VAGCAKQGELAVGQRLDLDEPGGAGALGGGDGPATGASPFGQ
jgi:hypothetical protein